MSDIPAKDNQCGLDLTRPPSTKDSAISVVDVPICIASALTLQGFGRPVTDFSTEPLEIVPFPLPPGSWRSLVDGTGVEGGYVEDVFENQRIGNVQYSVNVGLKRKYVIGWYGHDPLEAALGTSVPILSPTSILTHEVSLISRHFFALILLNSNYYLTHCCYYSLKNVINHVVKAREADFRVMEGKVLRAALQRARAAKHERKVLTARTKRTVEDLARNTYSLLILFNSLLT